MTEAAASRPERELIDLGMIGLLARLAWMHPRRADTAR
jgi:hypothetical protein